MTHRALQPTAIAPKAGTYRAGKPLVQAAVLLAVEPIAGYAGDGEMDWSEFEDMWSDLCNR